MFLQAVLGAVHLAAVGAGVAGTPHKMAALNVILHPVFALHDLGAEETPPGVLGLVLQHLLHVRRHIYDQPEIRDSFKSSQIQPLIDVIYTVC